MSVKPKKPVHPHRRVASSPAKTHTITKTYVKTNTQIALATLALILASGLAFAASRPRTPRNACSIQQVQFEQACKTKNRFRQVTFTCSDGTIRTIRKNTCNKTSKLQQYAEKACARRQCVVETPVPTQPAPVPAAVPASEAPSVTENSATGSQNSATGSGSLNQPVQKFKQESVSYTEPMVTFVGAKFMVSPNGSKMQFSLFLENLGKPFSAQDATYTLEFLDSDGQVVQAYEIELGQGIDRGGVHRVSTVLPVGETVRSARATLPSRFFPSVGVQSAVVDLQ